MVGFRSVVGIGGRPVGGVSGGLFTLGVGARYTGVGGGILSSDIKELMFCSR